MWQFTYNGFTKWFLSGLGFQGWLNPSCSTTPTFKRPPSLSRMAAILSRFMLRPRFKELVSGLSNFTLPSRARIQILISALSSFPSQATSIWQHSAHSPHLLLVVERKRQAQLKLLVRGPLTVQLPAFPALSFPTVDLSPPDVPGRQNHSTHTYCIITSLTEFVTTSKATNIQPKKCHHSTE